MSRERFYPTPCSCGALIPRTGKKGRPPSQCEDCRAGDPPKLRAGRGRHPRDRAEVSAWQRIVDAGIAAEVCDAIVLTQPVPGALLRALGGSL